MKINLGCGQKKIPGWVNVDKVPTIGADVIHDLEQLPWPFADNSVDEILMDAVLEHLLNPLQKFAEIYRILKPRGIATIKVPYACSVWAFQDPTHVSYFTERTLDYLRDGFEYNFYTGIRFNVLSAELTTGADSLTAKLRNLIPCRKLLRWFLWNMYDGVTYVIQKPREGE